MLKLLWMEDTVKGVSTPELIGPCHINAHIRVISTESSPELSSSFAEGDGRTLIFSQQEMWPAKQAADHLNWESSPGRRLIAFPKRTLERHKVVPQGGDEEVLVPCHVRPALLEGFVGRWP
jgi:hypothetical protein